MRNELNQRSNYEELVNQVRHVPRAKKTTHDELLNRVSNRKKQDKMLKLHMRQLEHAKNQIEARENKSQSITQRKQWIERQNNANYRNEYDRIRNALDKTVLKNSPLPSQTMEKLQQREEELKRLFSNGNV